MEYEQIKKLMEDMGNSKLTDVKIEFPDGIKISMKKDISNNQIEKLVDMITTEDKEEKREIQTSKEISTEEKCKNDDEYKIIKSPMVGTFYSKPSPEEKPYVQVGQEVKKGDILCIIEAMKLLNEIESEFDGKIEEILVKDGEPVDFGKPLFKIS